MTERQSVVTALPGLTLGELREHAPEGSLEASVVEQIAALRRLGYIEPHHAAQVQLALVAARDIDWSTGRGAPSGRANLLRVMNEILERLPQPVAASTDKLSEILLVLRGEHPEQPELEESHVSE